MACQRLDPWPNICVAKRHLQCEAGFALPSNGTTIALGGPRGIIQRVFRRQLRIEALGPRLGTEVSGDEPPQGTCPGGHK